MSRAFNRLVFRHAAADKTHCFASSVEWAQRTLVVRCPPPTRSLAIAGGVTSVSISSGYIKQRLFPRNSELIPHNWRPDNQNTRFYHYVNVSSSSTDLYSGRQLTIQPIVEVEALGGHKPRWRCDTSPLRSL